MNNENQYPMNVAVKIIHYLDDDEIVKKEKIILKGTARLSKSKASEILDERNIKHDHIVFVENTNTTLKGELKMDYSDQVLKSEIINLETQIKRDQKILKAYQQNVHKKENDIFESNKKLEQLKRRMLHD